MSSGLLYFNGIDGDTGRYALPPLTADALADAIRGEGTPDNLAELRLRRRLATAGFLGVKEGIDATRLDEAGWGVIFPAYPTTDPDREAKEQRAAAIREALAPLLQLRRAQAGEAFAPWCQGADKSFRVGADSKSSWLARHGAGPGPADPDRVPYYLLIVGSPEEIPYRFQTQLDVQYAVGRLHFETLDGYAAYAANVVEAETRALARARRATFFGVANPGDPATALSATRLVEPLADALRDAHPDWTIEWEAPETATKTRLATLLSPTAPALLFSASHGMSFDHDSPRQRPHQGALLCQDWPGPQQWTGEIPQDFYFAGDDLTGDADLGGLIAFFFACFGGGTPQHSAFAHYDRPGAAPGAPPEIAPFPFLARLPVQMLGRSRGALAVVGHVERAWSYSFDWGRAGAQTTVFESTLTRLLKGHPVGSALEYFNERYAELATVLSDTLEDIDAGKRFDPYELAGMWTANNDARGYALIGDPAVRLPVGAAVGYTARADEHESATVPAGSLAHRAPHSHSPAVSVVGGAMAENNLERFDDDGFQRLLRETERRFDERAAARAATQEHIDAGKLLEADTPERVARRLERLKLDRSAAFALTAGGISFAPIAGVGPAEPAVLERILGTSDLMGVSFLELGLLVARTVGRVHCRNRVGRTVAYGTGFMVSPRLMLTNNHVLDNADLAATSQIEFDYQIGLDGKPAPSIFFNLAPADFFLTDAVLDYTLVAVGSQRPDGRTPADFGWNRLVEEEGKVIKGEYVNIIQHPNGEPKQLALRENQLQDVLEHWLHYHTDTAAGSSGSPVFNDQWEVVALHHSGVPRRDEHGNILARDGQVWRPVMGEHRINWLANEGARISRIVRHIRAQALPPAKARLRDEMFAAEPPALRWPSEQVPVPIEPGPGLVTTVTGTVGDGSATWTIPIEVTVRLAPPTLAPQPRSPEAPEPPGETPPTPPSDADLAAALADLAEAPTRVYYDEAGDTEAAEAYYAGIDVPSLDPGVLYAQLSALLKTTHATQPRYKPLVHVYPWVELHPDLRIRSIYSGIDHEPETLMLEDLSVDAERARRTNALLTTEAARDVTALHEALDLLEAQLPYNCEHVVPQSWFGKLEPMRGDLHHLFACESGCNSFRGNQAYYDFEDFEEAIRSNCGKREQNRFEPGSAKGKSAVARATLYFLLRYPGLIAIAGGELDAERLPLLLAWHAASPPNSYERHRNAAIFEKQGNRNPLIDHPEWAERIDFSLGFGD